jgi:HEAT repeat protein
MNVKPFLLSILAALLAGCTQTDHELLEKLSQRTHWLKDQVLLLEEKAGQNEAALERLKDRYVDLDTRHKRIDLEFKLIQNRLKPMRELGEKDQAEEKMFQLVAQIPTASDEEWPALRKKLAAFGNLIVPALLQAYQEGHMARAGEAILALRDPRALTTLVAALAISKTRLIAAEALEKLGSTEAIEHLAPYLDNEDLSVRMQVASALGTLGDMSGIPVLIEVLDHPEFTRRWLANSLIEKFSGTSYQYKAELNKERRQPFIARWKAWWRKNRDRFDLAHEGAGKKPKKNTDGEGEKKGDPEGPGGD